MHAGAVEGEHVAAAEIEDDIAPRLMREGAERMSVEQRRVEDQPVGRGVKVGDRILVETDGEWLRIATVQLQAGSARRWRVNPTSRPSSAGCGAGWRCGTGMRPNEPC